MRHYSPRLLGLLACLLLDFESLWLKFLVRLSVENTCPIDVVDAKLLYFSLL